MNCDVRYVICCSCTVDDGDGDGDGDGGLRHTKYVRSSDQFRRKVRIYLQYLISMSLSPSWPRGKDDDVDLMLKWYMKWELKTKVGVNHITYAEER